MGSGVWFKNIISKKKVKGAGSQSLKRYSAPGNTSACKEGTCLEKDCCTLSANGASVDKDAIRSNLIENAAATRIQTAYRAYLVRKTFHQMRGMVRLRNMVKSDAVKKQASSTLSHLHSWSRVQSQIRTRRVHMVMEGRLRQRKLENQLKLDAKIHDLEVEWSGGSDTMDRALSRIHQREEAALKRERAMAYAFTHQWRANSSPSFGSSNQELSKENWGWSWMDRWIAARPWESRVAPAKESPKKSRTSQPGKNSVSPLGKNKVSPLGKSRVSPLGKTSVSPLGKTPTKVKSISPNGKSSSKVRKLSYEAAGQKTAAKKVSTKAEEEHIKIELEV